MFREIHSDMVVYNSIHTHLLHANALNNLNVGEMEFTQKKF